MEFMLLFLEEKGGAEHLPGTFAEMNKLANELADESKLRRGAPLQERAVRVRVHGGETLVSDGPFAESKEVVGGFWIVDVAGRDEAIEIARRAPHARAGIVEVRAVQWRKQVADPQEGTPFMMVFGVEPGLTDSHGDKMREMVAFSEGLDRAGQFIETAPLTADPPAARVETRGGTLLVTDGPFAEAKEAIGGYALVRLRGWPEAVELARRYPHAKWGTVEVREVIFFDKT